MKIERKIILSNSFNLALLLLTGLFAFQNLNNVVTKLRFAEIADDLNASFLEMRLAEKNYILYHTPSLLSDIEEKIQSSTAVIDASRTDIVKAVGEEKLDLLMSHIRKYSIIVNEMSRSEKTDSSLQLRLRIEGKALREFSEGITKVERGQVNDIISRSKDLLLYSFCAILLVGIFVSHFISQKILNSLRAIQRLTKSISGGNFEKIEGATSSDELGSVMNALNSMSEELRNREEQLIQSKKLASIGVLTAGVAHELTNPLNNISMIAQTFDELYQSLTDEQKIDFMKKIDVETVRIKEIVRNLLDFSRPKEANLKQADINAVIRRTLNLMQNTIDIANVEAKANLEDRLPPVLVDENQIQQVLVNLVTNALHAMPHGGSLLIFSRNGLRKGFVEIDVTDNGKGISPEFLPHVFDPFFTTKGEGGTGLGLSVSYGIIKKHKGDIRVESWIGEGSTFTIELPIFQKEAGKDEQI